MEIPLQETIIDKIDQWHEKNQEPPRPHLGASMLGHDCARWLWLSFHWAVVEKFPGRVLRLFRRGHLEEVNLVSDLRKAGLDLINVGNNQMRVDFNSHISGSLDGIITSGVPEAPDKRHIVEFKTHSKKSFDELLKKGVKEAKPVHYAQMQVYMYGTEIDRALYVAICKDDDRLYTERVKLVKKEAKKWIDRGKNIAVSPRLPEPLSADPTWYQCRFCAAHDFCHKSKLTKEVNCRTCAHSTAEENSTWSCARYPDRPIPIDFQRKGCEHHVLHPDLVPWQLMDSDNDECACYEIDGVRVHNGKQDGTKVFSSIELISNSIECVRLVDAGEDDFMKAARDAFDGEIVG